MEVQERDVMGKNSEILRLMQYLQNEGIQMTVDFVKDVQKLVQTDVETFASQFFKDFSRKDFENYNRFEKLKLTKQQKASIDGNILWRYEYRNTSNFRCIFIVEKAHNSNIPILICAFNENGGKKRGDNSYNHNIKRAIDIIKKNSS